MISPVPESILETIKLIKRLEVVLAQRKREHRECLTGREKHTLPFRCRQQKRFQGVEVAGLLPVHREEGATCCRRGLVGRDLSF